MTVGGVNTMKATNATKIFAERIVISCAWTRVHATTNLVRRNERNSYGYKKKVLHTKAKGFSFLVKLEQFVVFCADLDKKTSKQSYLRKHERKRRK